jgi:hypothetical protein
METVPDIHMTNKALGISASMMPMHLKDGQDWADEVTATLTREQWAIIQTMLTIQLNALSETMPAIARAGREGDTAAALIALGAAATGNDLMVTLRAVTTIIDPDLIAEVDAELAAEAASK